MGFWPGRGACRRARPGCPGDEGGEAGEDESAVPAGSARVNCGRSADAGAAALAVAANMVGAMPMVHSGRSSMASHSANAGYTVFVKGGPEPDNYSIYESRNGRIEARGFGRQPSQRDRSRTSAAVPATYGAAVAACSAVLRWIWPAVGPADATTAIMLKATVQPTRPPKDSSRLSADSGTISPQWTHRCGPCLTVRRGLNDRSSTGRWPTCLAGHAAGLWIVSR